MGYTKKGTAECSSFFGGERGIRTPGTVTRTPHFECGPIDHSGISPVVSACKCTNYFLSSDISAAKKVYSPHFFAVSEATIH